MRQKIRWLSLVLGTLIIAIFVIGGLRAQAKEIETTGLDADSAKIILLSDGSTVANDSVLKDGTRYRIDYTWTIPDGVQVNDGDTAKVYLPQNDNPHDDASGYVMATVNGVKDVHVGVLRVSADSDEATITFNDALKDTNVKREGHITISATGHGTATGGQDSNSTNSSDSTGTEPSGSGGGTGGSGGSATNPSGSDSAGSGSYDLNKVGWGASSVALNEVEAAPTEIVWNVIFDGRGDDFGDTTILDELGPYQTYIPGSFVMNDYSKNVSYTINTSGNNIMFGFAAVHQPVGFTFRTKLSDLTGYGERYNTAIMTTTNSYPAGRDTGASGTTTSAQVLAAYNWGLKADVNGDYFGSVQLTKYATKTGGDSPDKKLSGAKYDLHSTNDKTFSQQYVTGPEGNLTVPGLRAGAYYFSEAEAPSGYALNKNDVSFTIAPENGTSAVQVSQYDDLSSEPSEPSSSSTSVPGEPSGSSTSVPSEPSGSSTSVPSEPSGSSTSVPSETSGSSTSVPSEPSDSSASVPSEPSSSSTSVPGIPSSSTTSSVPEIPSVSHSSSTPSGSKPSGDDSSEPSSSSSRVVVTTTGGDTGQSTPTSTAQSVSQSGNGGVGDHSKITATMTAKTDSTKQPIISRLPQTDDQKADVVFLGLLLLGGTLSYTAWRRNRD
ncbi:SpaA isopeptide-forming pilin-related protein [Levilactobacillus zymae]|uniref:SpaA isopeptide-forming pilin-related protein n=1 Tax=Levilactobacillus zymae TaxID=267363 RepID=UPI003FCE1197